jgi:hypothetical protein
VARPWPGGENRISGRASHHEECDAMESFLLPCVATGISPLAVYCLRGATPREQPWTSAVTLPHGRNGQNARRMAVLSTCPEPSLCRQVHRELLRNVLLDLTPLIAATACHQRNYAERYSRFNEFPHLVPPCEAAFHARMATWLMDGKPRMARRFTVYQNCSLPIPEDVEHYQPLSWW